MAEGTAAMGRFITFEGTEGCGKSTQIQRLADRLTQTDPGHPPVLLREPGGTPIGEAIRRIVKESDGTDPMCAETELLLIAAARAQLVRTVIRPALEQGRTVLCDRFFDSTTAYQGYGRQLPFDIVRQCIEMATAGLAPHLTILLTIPIETSEVRRLGRASAAGSKNPEESTNSAESTTDRFESMDRDFFRRVEAGYAEIAARKPGRVIPVDGVGTQDDVEARVWKVVRERWPELGAH